MQTTNIFYTLPQLDLCDRLAELTPERDHAHVLHQLGHRGGRGRAQARAPRHRPECSCRREARSTAARSARSGDRARRSTAIRIAPLLPEQVLVPFDDLAAARRAVDASVAAFIVEPVQGEGGVNVRARGLSARAARALRRERARC